MKVGYDDHSFAGTKRKKTLKFRRKYTISANQVNFDLLVVILTNLEQIYENGASTVERGIDDLSFATKKKKID